MSSILSALAPNRTSSTGAGGKEGELGQQSTKAQESLVQNSLDAASVERIRLPLLSDRGQKIFKLTPLLSKATLSPNEGMLTLIICCWRNVQVVVTFRRYLAREDVHLSTLVMWCICATAWNSVRYAVGYLFIWKCVGLCYW